MRITVDQAREYFMDPSQHLFGITPDNLPDDPVQYWAHEDLCGVFHPAPWPDVWMGHYAMKPSGRGRSDETARYILTQFWQSERPSRIVGWTDASNKRALAFAKRIGFTVDGTMPTEKGDVVMTGWRL